MAEGVCQGVTGPIMTSFSWSDLFQGAQVRSVLWYRFDHNVFLREMKKRSFEDIHERLFKFEPLWLSNVECDRVVKQA